MTEQNPLVWEGGQVVKVRPVPVPLPRPGWVTVDIAYPGICGSDLHVAAGEHIRVQPGTVLGHEFVGHLAEPYGDLPAGYPVFVKPMVDALDSLRRGEGMKVLIEPGRMGAT
jgi:(R,R)-butanediol dehydrogenase / meso-butanediol dehydrogenase / diacetyl reductase